MKKIYIIGIALLFSVCATSTQAETFDFGVNAPSGALVAQKQWMPLAKYLSEKTGHTFNILPLDPKKIEEAVKTAQADFALANPVGAAALIHNGSAKNIATMLEGDQGSQFGGVIFTKAGGPSTLAELKGKRILVYQRTSAGAYVFQMAHLKQAGINAADLTFLPDAKTQNDIVLAVQAGVADVGFVRTGILEKMAKDGKVSMADFVIIDKKNDSFPLVHTTDLYPEWQIVVSTKGDGMAVADSLAKALMTLKETDEAAQSAHIKGFSEPQSMDGIVKAMTDAKVPPFDQTSR
jgi:two-component system, LuxR family, sensor histidine kinase TtrS